MKHPSQRCGRYLAFCSALLGLWLSGNAGEIVDAAKARERLASPAAVALSERMQQLRKDGAARELAELARTQLVDVRGDPVATDSLLEHALLLLAELPRVAEGHALASALQSR